MWTGKGSHSTRFFRTSEYTQSSELQAKEDPTENTQYHVVWFYSWSLSAGGVIKQLSINILLLKSIFKVNRSSRPVRTRCSKGKLLTQTGSRAWSILICDLNVSHFAALPASIYHPLSHVSFLNYCLLTFVTYAAKRFESPASPQPTPFDCILILIVKDEEIATRAPFTKHVWMFLNKENQRKFLISDPIIDLISSPLYGLKWKKKMRFGARKLGEGRWKW